MDGRVRRCDGDVGPREVLALVLARQAFEKLIERRLAARKPGAVVRGGKRLNLKVDPNAPLKDPKTYTIVGKPILRPDVPDKCTGRNVYVQDHSLPGMLHGRVIHPPSIGAAQVPESPT